jgi:cytochrome d ubiquinol oxidase subunit II
VSALAGVAAFALVATRRLELARLASAVAVTAVIAGWALAQRSELLPGLTIDQAAAPRATLVATLVGLAVGSLILIPSLALLFRMVLRGAFDAPAADGRWKVAATARPWRDPQRATTVCLLGLVAGALVLVVGDAAWSIAIGVLLLLASGACGFVVVARSLATAES